MKGSRKSFHIPGSTKHYSADREYRTEHIKVQLQVDLEQRRIQGSCSLRIRPLGSSRTLRFDACEMRIESVEVDERKAHFSHDGEVLKVRADRDLPKDEPRVVTVKYSAAPKNGIYFVHPDKDYPAKPVQAWTQCEAEAARFWFPCHDHPDDKSTSEMVITVQAGYQVISNGVLVGRHEREDGWTSYHWSETAPHSTYLNSFVIGRFEVIEETAEGVPLQYYFPQEKKADARRYFGLTPDMLRFFTEVTGVKYPFGKYAQVAVHDFIYGGMENIGATTLTDTRFPTEGTEEDYAARYSRPDRTHVELVAHELVHMWFGDLVTTKNWAHAWLNEGFATYFEAVYHEARFGADEFRQNMIYKAQLHFDEDETRYRRAIVDNEYLFADDVFDTFVYEKASWMLHQLRYIMGDGPFFAGSSEYLKRFALGNVDTHDCMRVMEEVSGVSLEQYFEQSFFKAGHPEFEVEYGWEEVLSEASVKVRQVQQVDELTPAFFVLPCDLVFYTARGRQVRRVMLRGAEESYHFVLDSEPRIVEFDPEERLLKSVKFKKKSRALLLNQLEESVDASSRVRAARDLATFADDETVEALRKAIVREQFWAVGAEAARSLGQMGTNDALEVLLALVEGTGNRRVRRGIVAALAEFTGNERVHEVLKRVLFNDASLYIRCEAALSLAKSGAKDAVAVLSQSMQLPSPEYGLTEASIEALGYVKGSTDARQIIRDHLAYGNPTRVRIGAVKGYIKLGSLEDADVQLFKEIAVKDPDFFVRDQVLELIAELGDKRFVATLGKVSEVDIDRRNRRRAIEVLQGILSQDASSAVSGLRDDVEKLKAKNRELAEKLAGLERVPGDRA